MFPVKRKSSGSVSLPAPIGGWNARDSLADMPATDAVYLTNWFPATTECVLRKGYARWATGITGTVETLMSYEGGNVSKLFAISTNGTVYDVTSQGAAVATSLTGLSNARWQYTNFATAGGNYLYMANGVNTPYVYNGTTYVSVTGVSTPAITGVTTTDLNNPIVFKQRIFFTQKNTLKTWYLPVSSIGGAANTIDVSQYAYKGGYVVNHATWTLDAGYGADDYYVIYTSKGQVVVFKGTDPSSATTWSMIGVWDLAVPIGNRCMYKYGGDLLLLGADGVTPMASELQSSRLDPRVALTDKIQWAVSEAISLYGSTFGWQMIFYPQENQLWVNVPNANGTEQFAMNTISKNWCNYTGWSASCFEIFQDEPYFGANGYVARAYYTNADDTSNIIGTGLQAFSDFNSPGQTKRFTMAKPIFRTTGNPAIYVNINLDFNITDPSTSLNYTPSTAATWDSALWDAATWGGGLSILQQWQGLNGVGYYGAPIVKTASQGIDTRWVTTDIVIEKGAVL
jgi:hypothetical protein